ncbi:hypothetical protein DIPPA_20820 [Diplonema papillatum]|nr:hypothetical protein DIPPA_20820 [Diplonema papillatum]
MTSYLEKQAREKDREITSDLNRLALDVSTVQKKARGRGYDSGYSGMSSAAIEVELVQKYETMKRVLEQNAAERVESMKKRYQEEYCRSKDLQFEQVRKLEEEMHSLRKKLHIATTELEATQGNYRDLQLLHLNDQELALDLGNLHQVLKGKDSMIQKLVMDLKDSEGQVKELREHLNLAIEAIQLRHRENQELNRRLSEARGKAKAHKAATERDALNQSRASAASSTSGTVHEELERAKEAKRELELQVWKLGNLASAPPTADFAAILSLVSGKLAAAVAPPPAADDPSQQCAEQSKRIAHLERALDERAADAEAAAAEVERLRGELDAGSGRQSKAGRLERELAEQAAAWKASAASSSAELSEKADEISRLQRKVDALTVSDDHQSKVSRLEHDLSTMQAELRAKTEETERLQRKVDTLTVSDDHQAKVSRLEHDLTVLQAESLAKTEETERLQRKVDALTVSDDHQAKVSRLEHDLTTLQAELRAKTEEAETLHREAASRAVPDHQPQLARLLDEAAASAAALSALESRASAHQAAAAAAESRANALDTERGSLLGKIAMHEQLEAQVEARVAGLTREAEAADGLRAEVDDLKLECQRLKAAETRHAEEADRRSKETAALLHSEGEWRERCVEFEREAADRKRDLADAEAAAKARADAVERLEARVRELEGLAGEGEAAGKQAAQSSTAKDEEVGRLKSFVGILQQKVAQQEAAGKLKDAEADRHRAAAEALRADLEARPADAAGAVAAAQYTLSLLQTNSKLTSAYRTRLQQLQSVAGKVCKLEIELKEEENKRTMRVQSLKEQLRDVIAERNGLKTEVKEAQQRLREAKGG